jgi:hypothetical protein
MLWQARRLGAWTRGVSRTAVSEQLASYFTSIHQIMLVQMRAYDRGTGHVVCLMQDKQARS